MAINTLGSNSPSRPVYLLQNATAIAASAVVDSAIKVMRRQVAYVEVFCTQQFSVDIFASMDEEQTGVTDTSYLYQPNQFTNRINGTGLAGSASVGRSTIIELRGVIGALIIRVQNTSASAGTCTVKVALA